MRMDGCPAAINFYDAVPATVAEFRSCCYPVCLRSSYAMTAYAGDDVHFLKTGIVVCCLLLAACHAIRDEADPNTVSVRGIRPTLEQLNTSSTTAAQNSFILDLTAKAGFVDEKTGLPYSLPVRSPDWATVTEAGIYEISRQCDQYLDVLFHFNRNQRALRQGLTATGATTATILGLASVAAAPIAIVAAAFGLSASLFDAGVNSVLFTIEPSALRNIALKGRQGYLDELKTKMNEVDTRPRMMIALQGYLVQCSPAAIEANVNNAASGAPSVASTNKDVSREQATLGAPSQTLLQRAASTTRGAVTNSPVPIDQASKPTGAMRREENIFKSDVARVQAALGVNIDGDFGAATRSAIKEFQRGLNRRFPKAWTNVDGTGNIVDLPPNLSKLPAVFASPFERAYFGAVDPTTQPLEEQYVKVSPQRLNGFIRRLSFPAAPAPGELVPADAADADLAKAMATMRIKLGERLQAGKAVPLTSEIQDKIPTAGD